MLALRRATALESAASTQEDDPRLAAARARLRACQDPFASLSNDDWNAIRSYEGPEISGRMRKRRHA
jgi:hypothetical protein